LAGNIGTSHIYGGGVTFDKTPPTIKDISVNEPGSFKQDDEIILKVTFDETIYVSGQPFIELNTGGKATYTIGSGSDVLDFTYKVGSGENTDSLDCLGSLDLNGGSVLDAAGNETELLLPVGVGNLGDNTTIIIDTIALILTDILYVEQHYDCPRAASAPAPSSHSFTFNSNKAGTIDANVEFTTDNSVINGVNTITFNSLQPGTGTYYDIEINVADAAGNSNSASLPSFVIGPYYEMPFCAEHVVEIKTDQGLYKLEEITSCHTINGLKAKHVIKTQQLITLIKYRRELFNLGTCASPSEHDGNSNEDEYDTGGVYIGDINRTVIEKAPIRNFNNDEIVSSYLDNFNIKDNNTTVLTNNEHLMYDIKSSFSLPLTGGYWSTNQSSGEHFITWDTTIYCSGNTIELKNDPDDVGSVFISKSPITIDKLITAKATGKFGIALSGAKKDLIPIRGDVNISNITEDEILLISQVKWTKDSQLTITLKPNCIYYIRIILINIGGPGTMALQYKPGTGSNDFIDFSSNKVLDP